MFYTLVSLLSIVLCIGGPPAYCIFFADLFDLADLLPDLRLFWLFFEVLFLDFDLVDLRDLVDFLDLPDFRDFVVNWLI